MPETLFDRDYFACLKIAESRARFFAVFGSLPPDSRRDLRQEALLELWRKAPRFDGGRASWCTFAERVITNRLRSLARFCLSRGHLEGESLDEAALNLPAHDTLRLRLDVMRVLASVSDFDQRVALNLTEYSAMETSRRLGVSRSTAYLAIERLRVAFTLAGFDGATQRY